MIPLKQSKASQEIPLGHFLDSGDGDTEETGLTIANTDIKIWKNGASSLANKNSGGATHISNGIYYCTLDDTDTNTAGPLIIFIHVSGALAVKLDCVVYPAGVYDVLFGNVEGALDIQKVLRLLLSAMALKTSGGGTTSLKSRDLADSKDRITLTVDSNGNRTAVTLDGA